MAARFDAASAGSFAIDRRSPASPLFSMYAPSDGGPSTSSLKSWARDVCMGDVVVIDRS